MGRIVWYVGYILLNSEDYTQQMITDNAWPYTMKFRLARDMPHILAGLFLPDVVSTVFFFFARAKIPHERLSISDD